MVLISLLQAGGMPGEGRFHTIPRQGSGQAGFILGKTNCPETALEPTGGLLMHFRKRKMIQTQSCLGHKNFFL